MSTKLYGLVAVTVGALLLGPGRALAAPTQTEWDNCLIAWDFDEAFCESILNGRPEPPPDPVPQPDPTPVPQPDPTPVPQPDPTPVPQPDPTPVPPPPPPPPQCENGNHSGHAVASSGNATGHVCGGNQGSDRHGHGKKPKHSHRGHGYAAHAKAAFNHFTTWCKSFASNHGRH